MSESPDGHEPLATRSTIASGGAGLVDNDVIAAISTAPGRGAIAVVRMSGADATSVAARVLEPWPIPVREPRLCTVRDPRDGAVVDRAVVTRYAAPRSYTGEDLLEIATHGGLVVPAGVLAALVSSGAREAMPGEFTRRAVLNGKLDLAQAEAIGDLIDATSTAMQRAALGQLDGGLSRRIAILREQLIGLEALIAYDIDFPDEDDGPIPPARVRREVRVALDALAALVATAPAGELVRAGAAIVIAGAPNAGKSSLFNALLGQARAIVTEVPGTTRDAIEAVLDTPRWPLRLVDTAGLREAEDVVEALGIEVSERWLARADVVLVCGDTPEAIADARARVTASSAAPVVAAWTKSDLRNGASVERTHGSHGNHANDGRDGVHRGDAESGDDVVAVSAATGEGLSTLVSRLLAVIDARVGGMSAELPLVTRARHRRALEEALAELVEFERGWFDEHLPAPVAAVHLRAATMALESVIGAVEVEEVLGRLFSSFCVGK